MNVYQNDYQVFVRHIQIRETTLCKIWIQKVCIVLCSAWMHEPIVNVIDENTSVMHLKYMFAKIMIAYFCLTVSNLISLKVPPHIIFFS